MWQETTFAIGHIEDKYITQLDPKMLKEYEDSLSAYCDIKNSINTATAKGMKEGLAKGLEEGMAKGMAKGLKEGMAKGMEEGMAKGMEEGMAKGMEEGMVKGMRQGRDERSMEIARTMLALNLSVEQIAQVTGLSEDVVRCL